MNRSDIRVVDRVLSKVALGFMQAGLVGYELFPRVGVDSPSGKIIKFGKEAFAIINTRRAPGSATKRITVGFGAENYNLTNNALDAVVPREWLKDQVQVPGISFQTQSIQTVVQIENNNVEYEQSALARNAAAYGANNKLTLSGTDKWDDYDNSNPIKDVKDAKEAIRAKTGAYPNKMVIPSQVHNVLQEHPKLLAKLSNNDMQILTVADYQRIFDVEKVVIAGSVVTDESEDLVDLWGTDIVLAYVPTVITNRAQPSYGYTYVLEGHPSVEKPWFDRSVKSWISGVDFERAPILTGMESGFLMPAVIG